ncbi:MAG TPA: lipoprotein signal peptidase [Sedimenticola sp.]|nr:lipoprotein signal peptidase [Sedimenticola sp.]
MLRWLWLSAAVIGLDLGTKRLAETVLSPYEPLKLTSFFDLTLMYNTGAAFSFLSDQDGWQRWFFVVVAVLVTLVLGGWLATLKTGERLAAAALSLIIGGALGNLVDRVLYGHVTDFIHLHYQQWYWPAFNIADSAITVGVVLILLARRPDSAA